MTAAGPGSAAEARPLGVFPGNSSDSRAVLGYSKRQFYVHVVDSIRDTHKKAVKTRRHEFPHRKSEKCIEPFIRQ